MHKKATNPSMKTYRFQTFFSTVIELETSFTLPMLAIANAARTGLPSDGSTGARRCQGRIGPSAAQISKRFRFRPETPGTVKINFIYNQISLERGPEDESGP